MSSRIYDGFIGYPVNNAELEFSGSDKENRYLQNLKSQPADWYYRNNKVYYNYNSLGHRCKEADDIDLDNYLLFTGCSHTEGVGLELEKTFPHIVSKELGCDYYNLAVGGSGVDVMTHNLTMWYKKTQKLPRALIILQPELTRFVTYDSDNRFLQLHLSSDNSPDTIRFMVAGDKLKFFSDRYKINLMLIQELYKNCNLIKINWLAASTDMNCVLQSIDLARDLSHCGIESNAKLASDVLSLLR